jgi:hypothetical protein
MTLAIWSLDGVPCEESRGTKPAIVTQKSVDICSWSQLGLTRTRYEFSQHELSEKKSGLKAVSNPKDFNTYGDGARRTYRC